MSKRLFFSSVILLLVLSASLYASKRLYMAKLSTVAELHEVVDSTARGAATFGSSQNGNAWNFRVQVRNLSGEVTGAHFHGPATETENAGVILNLCGGGPCPSLDSDGIFDLQGRITSSSVLQGVTGEEFLDLLDDGLVYVNVHTALNPAGEARGQLVRRF